MLYKLINLEKVLNYLHTYLSVLHQVLLPYLKVKYNISKNIYIVYIIHIQIVMILVIIHVIILFENYVHKNLVVCMHSPESSSAAAC